MVPYWNITSGGILESSVRSEIASAAERIHVIFVDDCSDIRAATILSEAFDGVRNVSIVRNDRNGGPGYARNVGLRMTDTEWVVFADADDAMDISAYLSLVEAGTQSDADVVAGGYVVRLTGKECATAREFIECPAPSLTRTIERRAAVWRFALRVSFLRANNLQFCDLRYAEDLIFLLDLLRANPRYIAVTSINVTTYAAPESAPVPNEAEYRQVLSWLTSLCQTTSDPTVRRLICTWRLRIGSHQVANSRNRRAAGIAFIKVMTPSSRRELVDLVYSISRIASDIAQNPPLQFLRLRIKDSS